MKREEIRVRVVKGGNSRTLLLRTALNNVKRGWKIEDPNYDERGNAINKEAVVVAQKVAEIVESIDPEQVPTQSTEAILEQSVDPKLLAGIKRTKSVDKLRKRLLTEENLQIREALTTRINQLENE